MLNIGRVHLCIFSISNLWFAAFAEIETSKLQDLQVQLKPPTNITVFFRNSSFITISWDAPLVYDLQFNDTYDNNINITDSSMESMNSSSEELVNNSSFKNSTNSDLPVTIVSGRCLPFYILKKSAEEIIDTTLTFEMHTKDTLSNDRNVNLVPFSQGCVQKYRVKWHKTSENSKNVSSLEILATETTANISGLDKNTNYSIIVSAVYSINNSAIIVDKELESSVLFVKTTADETSEACQCDLYGTISPSLSCNKSSCSCKPGYFGKFCQMCAPGFYRSAHFYPCHRCPCQMPSATIHTCSLVEGFLQCLRCQPGYTGNLCHMCDNGFYRYGKSCIPCRCNGNTMKNETNICHPLIGSCFKCQYNTTGFFCERCLEGYVGDAIKAKNCTLKQDVIRMNIEKSSSISVVGIILGVVLVLVFASALAGMFLCIKYRRREKRWAFWIVEMKHNEDDVCSVQNDMASLENEPDLSFYGTKIKNSNKYSRLREDI